MRVVVLSAAVACALAQTAQLNTPVAAPSGTQAVASRQPLHVEAFAPLPLGAVRPGGWLKRQLQIQADGLTGHLDEFWADVGNNSGWLGGTGESWERGPYFVDGLVPLAYLLQDQRLIAKARPWIEWTLTHQDPDGRMGPAKNTDWWPNMVMLKALTQYQEATGDPRVVPFMQKVLRISPGALHGAAAARMGGGAVGGRARERPLAVQPHRRQSAARARAPAARSGDRLEAALRRFRVPREVDA